MFPLSVHISIILANRDNTNRFDAMFDNGKMLFHHNNERLSIFSNINNELSIGPLMTKKPVYVHKYGVEEFYTQLPESHTNPNLKLHDLVLSSSRKDIESRVDRDGIDEFVKEHSDKIFLIPGSFQEKNSDPNVYYFTVTYKGVKDNSVPRFRFKVCVDGLIRPINSDLQEEEEVHSNIDSVINDCLEFRPRWQDLNLSATGTQTTS